MADIPARKSTTIEVPTWLVYVGGCALAVCLLTVGYLIGRDSGRPAVAGDPAPQVTVAPRAEPAALVRAAPPTADARAPTTSPVPAPTRPAAAPAPAIPSPPAPTRRPAPANPQREAVASYFEALDAIGAEGGLSTSDPESLAMAILSQATTGDATAFNKLTAAQQLSLAAIRRVRPPAPAREHHRRTVALLEESTRLLSRLKQGLLDGNIAALGELSAQAERMKSQAEALERLAADLKRQAGLTP